MLSLHKQAVSRDVTAMVLEFQQKKQKRESFFVVVDDVDGGDHDVHRDTVDPRQRSSSDHKTLGLFHLHPRTVTMQEM